MNWKFALRPIPLVLILLLGFFYAPKVGDYAFHLQNTGAAGYPPATAWILNAISSFMPRELGLFFISVLASLILPYMLIFEITKKEQAAFFYAYGSQIPIMLSFLYFTPQAIMQVVLLLCLRWNWLFIPALIAAPFIHSEGWILLAVGVAWTAYKRWKND